ncbi:unnamed protein product [Choristocarpus tenellus]
MNCLKAWIEQVAEDVISNGNGGKQKGLSRESRLVHCVDVMEDESRLIIDDEENKIACFVTDPAKEDFTRSSGRTITSLRKCVVKLEAWEFSTTTICTARLNKDTKNLRGLGHPLCLLVFKLSRVGAERTYKEDAVDLNSRELCITLRGTNHRQQAKMLAAGQGLSNLADITGSYCPASPTEASDLHWDDCIPIPQGAITSQSGSNKTSPPEVDALLAGDSQENLFPSQESLMQPLPDPHLGSLPGPEPGPGLRQELVDDLYQTQECRGNVFSNQEELEMRTESEGFSESDSVHLGQSVSSLRIQESSSQTPVINPVAGVQQRSPEFQGPLGSEVEVTAGGGGEGNEGREGENIDGVGEGKMDLGNSPGVEDVQQVVEEESESESEIESESEEEDDPEIIMQEGFTELDVHVDDLEANNDEHREGGDRRESHLHGPCLEKQNMGVETKAAMAASPSALAGDTLCESEKATHQPKALPTCKGKQKVKPRVSCDDDAGFEPDPSPPTDTTPPSDEGELLASSQLQQPEPPYLTQDRSSAGSGARDTEQRQNRPLQVLEQRGNGSGAWAICREQGQVRGGGLGRSGGSCSCEGQADLSEEEVEEEEECLTDPVNEDGSALMLLGRSEGDEGIRGRFRRDLYPSGNVGSAVCGVDKRLDTRHEDSRYRFDRGLKENREDSELGSVGNAAALCLPLQWLPDRAGTWTRADPGAKGRTVLNAGAGNNSRGQKRKTSDMLVRVDPLWDGQGVPPIVARGYEADKMVAEWLDEPVVERWRQLQTSPPNLELTGVWKWLRGDATERQGSN